MSTATYHIGDTRDVVATIPDDSIDLVLTSPPFLALRSYLPDDHESKHAEIGSEANPAAFLDVLLELAAEWRRVLAPHGSIAIELGDTYSGKTGGFDNVKPEYETPGRTRATGLTSDRTGEGWPLAKSLALVPELFRIGLAYGINPLTGQPSPAGRWRVRNVVRWHRPNPPVGALGDKYRPATTDIVVACVSDRRWFDLDAVRTDAQQQTQRNTNGPKNQGRSDETASANFPAGAPPLDTWTIPTSHYKGAHYATWPPELCRIPIESMCPRQVCETCGEPRRRIVATERTVTDRPDTKARKGSRPDGGAFGASNSDFTSTRDTLGWTDCHHDDYRPGVVLDPFAGTGTTLAVATGHARDAIGIDIDPRNADLAQERVGMFLTITNQETTP